MALIDLALLDGQKVYVDTTEPQDETTLLNVGALSAPTTIYHGDGSINLTSILGVNAISANNIVATGGADVTLGSGLLDVSLLTSKNLLIDGDSSITLDASAVSVAGTLTNLLNSTTVEFSGGGAGKFQFNPPAIGLLSTFTITVNEMDAGDQIIIPYGGDGTFALREGKDLFGNYNGYNASTGYLTLTNGTGIFSQVNVKIKMTQAEYNAYAANRGAYLDGANDTFTFPGTVDPNEPPYVVPCFVRGTMILTEKGDVAVESLKVGDLVWTKDHGLQPIRWIGAKSVENMLSVLNEKIRPIRISAGALGLNTPAADLLVSPQHRVLVRSSIVKKMFGAEEVLVAAKQLLQVDGIDVVTDMNTVEYFHILFDQHEVVLSNGAETESLYTGPEAIKSLPKEAVDEIFSIFPELQEHNYTPVAARILPSGRQARKMAVRHIDNGKSLVAA